MWELQEQIEQVVDQYFEDASAQRVSAESVGLDARAGYVFISTEEGWIASSNARSLEYYGGFEYIGIEYRITVGEITFYSNDHDRVADALEYYEALQEQDDDDVVIRIPDNNGLK